jgi:hypothetical protein
MPIGEEASKGTSAQGAPKSSFFEFVYVMPAPEPRVAESPTMEAKAIEAELAILDQAFNECKQGYGEPLTDIIDEPDVE